MSGPINVLQITTSLTVGGAERLLYGLAQHLDPSRFHMHVCSVRAVGGDLLRADFERLGLPLYVIGARKTYRPHVLRDVARYARAHRIDLIHTHLTDADSVGGLVGRALGIPTIATLHNVPADYDAQRLDRRVLAHLALQLLATRLVGVSRRISAAFVREWRVPARRIVTIQNAVPMDELLAIAPGVSRAAGADGPVVTTIGRLTEQKAQHILLEAARAILPEHPAARFLLVGQGHLEQPLRERAQALGIAERVTFTGVRHDIPELLAQSDVFVLSSLWEGMPLTALEAMAAARPVVLSDVGGVRELVEHDRHGVLVPPGDVPALAGALRALLADEPRRRAMGARARERVRREFTLELMAAQYAALYEEVVQARRRTALRRVGADR